MFCPCCEEERYYRNKEYLRYHLKTKHGLEQIELAIKTIEGLIEELKSMDMTLTALSYIQDLTILRSVQKYFLEKLFKS